MTSSSNCTVHLIFSAEHEQTPTFLAVLLIIILMSFISLVVIGNLLVILVVATSRNLRSVTSMFITSLAVADLSVGILILPFSAANEVLNQGWIFGEIWCQVWLSIDVWVCTASIYNLLAISADRYIAIQKPLHYSRLVTRRRAKFAVLGVWLLSFFICFPPMILHWPEAFATESARCTCSPMGNSPGYIIYSAIGSFFFPMVGIVLIYIPIYRVAKKAAKSEYSTVIVNERKNSRKPSSQPESFVPPAELEPCLHTNHLTVDSYPLSYDTMPGDESPPSSTTSPATVCGSMTQGHRPSVQIRFHGLMQTVSMRGRPAARERD